MFFLATGRMAPIIAADCSEASVSGDLSITTSCAFSGTVNGVDSGTGSTNTAKLTASPGGTLTIMGTQTIAMGSLSLGGGNVVLIDGAAMKFGTPLWMVDADGDGFPENTTQYASATAPVNGIRRNQMTTMAIADVNDDEYCPDNFNPLDICNTCQTGGIINQTDGQDLFGECPLFYLCNGQSACSLHAKRIFLTSTKYKGNLGGLSGADLECQSRATAGSLGGTWKAWASDRTSSPSSRLTQAIYPYILVNEQTKIADTWDDLVDASLSASINMNELKSTVSGSIAVWTNTKSDGTIYSKTASTNCNNWTSAISSRTGRYGFNDLYTTASWTDDGNGACNGNRRLYCFEQ